ncbi:MAG: GntR family transcriptional regulator [Bosea sp. (in: a-proteobacteria)]
MARVTSAHNRTLTETIVNGLTQQIVSGHLTPGAALDETRLAELFGASRTPVREALRQMAASGLVELRPHRTPLVMRVDAHRFTEMFEVMAELEALCAARAAIAMPSTQRQALERFHMGMSAHVRGGNVAAYRQANIAFHALIYRGTANSYLEELLIATRDRVAPHRGVQLEAPTRLAQSYAEHGEIVTAILRADSAAAAQAMRRHLAQTRTTLDALSGDQAKQRIA